MQHWLDVYVARLRVPGWSAPLWRCVTAARGLRVRVQAGAGEVLVRSRGACVCECGERVTLPARRLTCGTVGEQDRALPEEIERAKACAIQDDESPDTIASLFRNGMIRSVGAILVAHMHGFPHLLLLRRERDGSWKLCVPYLASNDAHLLPSTV